MTRFMIPAVLALGLLFSSCGGGSAASTQTSAPATTKTKDTSGCLVGVASCAGGSAACKAAEQTIQQALAKTSKPIVELTVGVTPPTLTKADLARDRQKIRRAVAQVEALRSTYLACPGHDPNLDANVKALKTYLH